MSRPDRNDQTAPAVGSPLDGAVGGLVPKRVNNTSGDTLCTVRWMVETPVGWLGAYDREPFSALVQAERDRLRATIADEAFAATFQTMGQYRTALLRLLGVRGGHSARQQPGLVSVPSPKAAGSDQPASSLSDRDNPRSERSAVVAAIAANGADGGSLSAHHLTPNVRVEPPAEGRSALTRG